MSVHPNIRYARHRRSLTKAPVKGLAASALSRPAVSTDGISDATAARLWRELGKSVKQLEEGRAAYRKELQDAYEEGERLLKEILG